MHTVRVSLSTPAYSLTDPLDDYILEQLSNDYATNIKLNFSWDTRDDVYVPPYLLPSHVFFYVDRTSQGLSKNNLVLCVNCVYAMFLKMLQEKYPLLHNNSCSIPEYTTIYTINSL